MSNWALYQPAGLADRDQSHILFAQTMGYVERLPPCSRSARPYLGRGLVGVVGIAAYIAALACLIGMQFAVRRSLNLTVGLLAAFGLLIGAGHSTHAQLLRERGSRGALWQRRATALFIAGFGAAGATPPDEISVWWRVLVSGALVALIGFGIVLIFVQIPGGALIYSVLGLGAPSPA